MRNTSSLSGLVRKCTYRGHLACTYSTAIPVPPLFVGFFSGFSKIQAIPANWHRLQGPCKRSKSGIINVDRITYISLEFASVFTTPTCRTCETLKVCSSSNCNTQFVQAREPPVTDSVVLYRHRDERKMTNVWEGCGLDPGRRALERTHLRAVKRNCRHDRQLN